MIYVNGNISFVAKCAYYKYTVHVRSFQIKNPNTLA